MQFVGYKADGSTVVQVFTTDGIIDGTGPLPDFQTFTFGSEFTDLMRFEIPDNTYALDNLRFIPIIPEPGTVSLFVLGALVWRYARREVHTRLRHERCVAVNTKHAIQTAARALITVMTVLAIPACYAQGTLQEIRLTLEGQPPGTATIVQNYWDSGVWFRALEHSFVRVGAGLSGWPYNGTGYLQASPSDALVFSRLDARLFNMVSVDLAESTYQQPLTVRFDGYRPDGTTVSQEFTTDGIIDSTGPLPDFQTFYFGPEFSGVQRVEVPSLFPVWSLDNLVMTIPEPCTVSLLLLGAVIWRGLRRRLREK